MPEPVVITLGCRLNTFESEVMRRHACEAGLDDAIIVNTCAVTGEAVRQAAQAIRRLRRETPKARIIVTGCAAQIEPERFADMPEVDHVVGNSEKMRGETFKGLSTASSERVQVNDIMSVRELAPHMVDGFRSHTRAHVQIQNGCDHRCTFCIIPFGRGPSRSVPAGEIVSQVRSLVEKGYAEIVLTGVDITSYGRDLPGVATLGKLVRQILKYVPELSRLRLSSIDQVEADADLIIALADEERLMPHLHLSMQSGDDLTLKRMKRRHRRADAIAFCKRARALRPDVVFGADFISGFPTETDAMFESSCSIIDDCGLTYLHVFPFSPRRGTPAARMPQVPGATVKRRAAQLREKANAILANYLNNQRGNVVDVLVERGQKGRTPQFAEVAIVGMGSKSVGAVVQARVTNAEPTRLIGEVCA
jgi:threonylcarbamoyladenosine tRNA methylthiotransferase MtaB